MTHIAWNGIHVLTTVTRMGSPEQVRGQTWTYDDADAELVAVTGREGPAARLGHDLTLRWRHWHAEVEHVDGVPTSVRVTVPLEGLEVVRGDGGVKGLSAPERALARRQALKVLGGRTHPTIELHADTFEQGGGGWDVTGTLRVNGASSPCTLRVTERDGRLDVATTVRHSDVGVERVKLAAGALSVADQVEVRVEGLPDPRRGTSRA